VVKTGRSIELEPMSARERRLVHVALAENTDVYTESSGEGRDRRVVVIPS
ncbi:MAG: single-stranded DNA-binding protein, partial [SAR202 cluster bacterium]